MTFTPELGQMLLGQPGHGVRAGELHTARIGELARAVCRSHPDLYIAPIRWEDDEERFGDTAEQAAREHFLSWGGGYFENDVFLLHGYSYDETCHCGAWENPLPATAITTWAARTEDVRAVLCCCGDGASEYLQPGSAVPMPANFLHKPSGLRISWYKHAGRSCSLSHRITDEQWRTIIGSCLDSLPASTAAVTETAAWPVQSLRRAQHVKLVRFAAEHPAELRAAAERHEREMRF